MRPEPDHLRSAHPGILCRTMSGRRIFDILHAPEFDERGISAERAKVFGRLCGISEAQLVRALNAASVSFTDLMQYQVRAWKRSLHGNQLAFRVRDGFHIEKLFCHCLHDNFLHAQDFVRVYADVFGDFDRWRAKKAQPTQTEDAATACCCVIM
jgi:hypothetical protein